MVTLTWNPARLSSRAMTMTTPAHTAAAAQQCCTARRQPQPVVSILERGDAPARGKRARAKKS